MEIIWITGLVACFFTVAMYTSTIDQIKDIFRAGTSEGISPLIYLMMIVNCFFWTSYGYLTSDYYIIVPNVVGFTLGTLTLTLIYKYRINTFKSVI